MSIKINVKKNLPSFENKNLQKGLFTGMLAAAKFVVADAKQRTPVKTGNLKNSIFESGFGLKYKVGTPVSYAPYVEYGTKKQPAKPFLRPAAFDNVVTITQIISRFLGRFI